MTEQEQIDQFFMLQALAQGQLAFNSGEVPVGAIVVVGGEVVGRGFNRPITQLDPSAHAEVVAIRDAAKTMGNYRLAGATLYVTVEPCAMCAGCLIHSRIERLVYATTEPKSGVVESAMNFLDSDFLNHKVSVSAGVMAEQASELMSSFFKMRRENKKKLKQRGNNANVSG